MLTTTRYSLKKPETTDARSSLRTAISDNADAAEAKLEAAHYRRLAMFTGKVGAGVVSGTKFLIGGPLNGAQTTMIDAATGTSASHAVLIDPTDIGGGAAKMRLRIVYDVPSTGPGQQFTFGIYQLPSLLLVPSSTVAFTPGASSQSYGSNSVEVTVPTTGIAAFTVGFVLAGTTAASSLVYFNAFLDAVRA